MSGEAFRPVTSKKQLDADELRRQAEAVEQQGQWLVAGNLSFLQTGAGTTIFSRAAAGSVSQVAKLPILLTGRYSGAGTPPFRYSWKEQRERPGFPGQWEDRPGGQSGTFDLQPAFDLNADQDATASDFSGQVVWAWPAEAGTFWWFEGDVAGTSLSFKIVGHAICLSAFPDSFGRYDARLLVENPDGTLTDLGPGVGVAIWLRDANNTPALFLNEIYKVKKTGFADGREVYTTQDYNLLVTDDIASRAFNRVYRLAFGPYYTWEFTLLGPRQVAVTRVLNAREAGALVMPHVWDHDFGPTANHWVIAPGALPGMVTVDRSLYVRREDVPAAGMSIWDIVLAPGSPNQMWTVTNDGLGRATVVRELNYRRGGVLVQARVWDVNHFPPDNWQMAGGGDGTVAVARVFDVRLGWGGGAILVSSFVYRQDFGPTPAHWDLREVGAGQVELSRVLDVRSNSGTIGSTAAINDIRFVPPQTGANQSWEVVVTGYRADVRRQFIILHNTTPAFFDIWRVRFVDSTPTYPDWTFTQEVDGAVSVSLAGQTVDVPLHKYLCVNNELVQLTGTLIFQRGSMKLWVNYA